MKRQRGVALITALLVVALAATAAVAMVSRQQLDIRRTGNLLELEQVQLYVQGIEDWVGVILRRDRQDGERDHLGEAWATVLPPVPIDGGQLTGFVTDAQSRFNLNNLAQGDDTARQLALDRLRRLLSLLAIDPALAQAVADWVDGDLERQGIGGAEDVEYLGFELPYRAANRKMADVSELLLIQGVTREIYRKLVAPEDGGPPYVTALPVETALNINTVPAARPELIAMLGDGLSAAAVREAVLDARPDEGFDTVDAMLQHAVFGGQTVPKQGLAVQSDYFRLTASVQVGNSFATMHSLLHRANNGVSRTVRRSQGN